MKNIDKKEGTAIVPGSFDPITNGHVAIIKKAASSFSKVIVAVMINDEKQYMFTLEQREAIARAALSDIENVTVISSRGWLWELAKDLGACAIVKGYRNETDLEYENKMARFNEEHYPAAKTVLLKAEENMTELSSTVVREKLRRKESLEDYIPKEAIEEINKITPKI